MWVPYNEGWGQWDTARIVEMIKKRDPTRLVDNASGWSDRGVGDVHDMHKYPGRVRRSRRQTGRRAGRIRRPGSASARPHLARREEWGYRKFTDAEALTAAYMDLVAKLFPLIDEKGLSAAVYTQTTDVETEVNGLMTYDRALVKMNLDKVAPANRGRR